KSANLPKSPGSREICASDSFHPSVLRPLREGSPAPESSDAVQDPASAERAIVLHASSEGLQPVPDLYQSGRRASIWPDRKLLGGMESLHSGLWVGLLGGGQYRDVVVGIEGERFHRSSFRWLGCPAVKDFFGRGAGG